MYKVPTVKLAENMLKEAENMNPGQWVLHNRIAGLCAVQIAQKCSDMNSDTAYVMGLLHDIGRRFGTSDLKHILYGYSHMIDNGYEDSARICLTHSFPLKEIGSYNGVNDCNAEESEFIQNYISSVEYNDYDKLIQLCDAFAYPTGACYLEKRLVDVVLQKGFNEFTTNKWKKLLSLKKYFDNRCNCDIYKLILH